MYQTMNTGIRQWKISDSIYLHFKDILLLQNFDLVPNVSLHETNLKIYPKENEKKQHLIVYSSTSWVKHPLLRSNPSFIVLFLYPWSYTYFDGNKMG